MSILRLIISSILRFFWGKAEDWYREELQYRKNKKEILNEVDSIAREAAKRNEDIAATRESIDDSLLRLDRVRRAKPDFDSDGRDNRHPFRNFKSRGETADTDGDSVDVAAISVPIGGSDTGDSGEGQLGVEPLGAEPDDSMPAD